MVISLLGPLTQSMRWRTWLPLMAPIATSGSPKLLTRPALQPFRFLLLGSRGTQLWLTQQSSR